MNEYVAGQGIASHVDCQPCFQNKIASLSLLSECTMTFTEVDWSGKACKEVKELVMEPKSLLILSGVARHDWTHGILGKNNITSRRISITFRNVILS
jgi:alkylated DNA repair dioxygenase AlkB